MCYGLSVPGKTFQVSFRSLQRISKGGTSQSVARKWFFSDGCQGNQMERDFKKLNAKEVVECLIISNSMLESF